VKTTESYCLFIDVLGFNERTIEAFESGNGDLLLDEYLNAVTKQIKDISNTQESIKKYSGKETFKIKVFTDNVVLSKTVTSIHGLTELEELIHPVMKICLNLALSGFFIRGGWDYGKLFMDDMTVFGPALLDAYSLESNTAIYPRIAISRVAREMFSNLSDQYHDPETSPLNQWFRIDKDGVMFVNYLWECVEQLEDTGHYLFSENAIKVHKTQIEACIRKYADNPRILAKYIWLGEYHNAFLEPFAYLYDDGFSDFCVNEYSLSQKLLF
jgi:hypothetical protein